MSHSTCYYDAMQLVSLHGGKVHAQGFISCLPLYHHSRQHGEHLTQILKTMESIAVAFFEYILVIFISILCPKGHSCAKKKLKDWFSIRRESRCFEGRLALNDTNYV